MICFKKEAVTLWVGGTFLKNPELIFFLFFFLKLLLENTGKDAKEEEDGGRGVDETAACLDYLHVTSSLQN